MERIKPLERDEAHPMRKSFMTLTNAPSVWCSTRRASWHTGLGPRGGEGVRTVGREGRHALRRFAGARLRARGDACWLSLLSGHQRCRWQRSRFLPRKDRRLPDLPHQSALIREAERVALELAEAMTACLCGHFRRPLFALATHALRRTATGGVGGDRREWRISAPASTASSGFEPNALYCPIQETANRKHENGRLNIPGFLDDEKSVCTAIILPSASNPPMTGKVPSPRFPRIYMKTEWRWV